MNCRDSRSSRGCRRRWGLSLFVMHYFSYSSVQITCFCFALFLLCFCSDFFCPICASLLLRFCMYIVSAQKMLHVITIHELVVTVFVSADCASWSCLYYVEHTHMCVQVKLLLTYMCGHGHAYTCIYKWGQLFFFTLVCAHERDHSDTCMYTWASSCHERHHGHTCIYTWARSCLNVYIDIISVIPTLNVT